MPNEALTTAGGLVLVAAGLTSWQAIFHDWLEYAGRVDFLQSCPLVESVAVTAECWRYWQSLMESVAVCYW
jgi:hypothetical protein